MASGSASFSASATMYGRDPADSYFAKNGISNFPGDVTVGGNLAVEGDATVQGAVDAGSLQSLTNVVIGSGPTRVKLVNDAAGNLLVSNGGAVKSGVVMGSLTLANDGGAQAGDISGVSYVTGSGPVITFQSPIHFGTGIPGPNPQIVSSTLAFINRLQVGSLNGSTPQSSGQSSGSFTIAGFLIQWGLFDVVTDARVTFTIPYLTGTNPVVVATAEINPTSTGYGVYCNVGPYVEADAFDVHVRGTTGAGSQESLVRWMSIGSSSIG